MSKFNVGDMVVINEPNTKTEEYWDRFGMDQYIEHIGKITDVMYNSHYDQPEYFVEGAEGWFWLESWLTPESALPNVSMEELSGVLGI